MRPPGNLPGALGAISEVLAGVHLMGSLIGDGMDGISSSSSSSSIMSLAERGEPK